MVRIIDGAVGTAKNDATFFGRTITAAVDDLTPDVISTFTGGKVTASVTQSETTLYRVWGGGSGQTSTWFTRQMPSSSAQAKGALSLPAHNAATFVTVVTVPAGTPIYEGTAAKMFGGTGGGDQIFIPREWVSGCQFGSTNPLQ